MAEVKKESFHKKQEHYSFEENTEEYCREIYRVALKHNDVLQKINVENQNFYDGKDEELKARSNNPRVKRSNLFVHELTPAVDSRVGGWESQLEEREFPVTIKPSDPKVDSATKDVVSEIERIIGLQLRDSGYLTDVFHEQALAAEIFRTPSVVKVGWRTAKKEVPIVVNGTIKEKWNNFWAGRSIKERVEYKLVDASGPYVEWLNPDEFLYEPNVSRFSDLTYCIHAMWLDYNELVARATEYGYDMDKITQYRDETTEDAGETPENDTLADAVQESRETPLEEGYRENKFLLTENWVATYDKGGREIVWTAVLVGNKYLVKKEKSDYKSIRMPFVPLIISRLPGVLEGMSSIDKGKYMQRLYNEGINSYLDGISYRIFPPFKMKLGEIFKEQPIYGPGEVWQLSDPDSLRPVVENIGQLPDLPALLEGISAKIRNALESQDLSQGFQARPYEKATSTNYRMMGARKTAMPSLKACGGAVKTVAEMFISLNQQFADDGFMFVQDMIVDVPSLTGVSDPDGVKQDTATLLSMMEQSPLFQTPLGQQKIRNLWEELIRAFKKTGVNNFVPSAEELEEQLAISAQMQAAMQDKQAAQEQMMIAQQESQAIPQQEMQNAV